MKAVNQFRGQKVNEWMNEFVFKVTRPGPINVRLIEAVWRAIVTVLYLSNGKF